MTKPILLILVILTIAIGAIYYYQKTTAEQLLNKLVDEGVISISEKVIALPILVIDSSQQSIHLLAGNKHQQIHFTEIKQINVYEAHEKGNNASEKVGPDYGTIVTQSDEQYRFDNLKLTATALVSLLKTYPALTFKVEHINKK